MTLPMATATSPSVGRMSSSLWLVGTVVWACGYRPDHSWIQLPVFDRRGRIRHDGGVVTDAPGVYVLGTKFLRRRRSTFINGAEQDTLELSAHLARSLDQRVTTAAG